MPICEVILDVCRKLGDAGRRRDPIEYDEAFTKQAKAVADAGDQETAAGLRLLAAVFSMCLKGDDDERFEPLGRLPDGRRTFLPVDLTTSEAAQLEILLDCSSDPVLVARIADVLWISLKKHQYARRALRAYLDSVAGETASWVPKRDWLRRATGLAMGLGRKAPERLEVKTKLEELFEESKVGCFAPTEGFWPAALAEILIDNRLASDWAKLGNECMVIAGGFPVAPGCDEPRKYCELAARAYDLAGLPAQSREARVLIRRHWEAEAAAFRAAGGDSFNISHRIERAIEAYREVGGEREKVNTLMGELKRANEKMITEMKSVSVPLNVEPLVRDAQGAMTGKVGVEAIAAFAGLYSTATYEEVCKNALSQSQASPLSAIIGAKIVAPEGNITAKVPGILEDEAGALLAIVVRSYTIRQNIEGATTLEVGRAMIQEGVDVSWKDALSQLPGISRFVPEDRQEIYERALMAGFAGDGLIFAHLVIPQLENSLRHVFREAGVPVTSIGAEGVQEERDLNRLLTDEAAKTVLGEGLVWEMRSLLVEKTGPNLRNRLCHGLLGAGDFDRPAMNLLLWLTVFLLLRYAGCGAS